MGRPAYEAALDERPQDWDGFTSLTGAMEAVSRPGRRLPFWASPRRRRRHEEFWFRLIREYAGKVYLLGRALHLPELAEGKVPQFVVLGYTDDSGSLLLASRTVVAASWQRHRGQGYTAVPFAGRTARLPSETVTVTAQMKDFEQLRGQDFSQLMDTMWRVLTGQPIPEDGHDA
jgi:hypothetical protein